MNQQKPASPKQSRLGLIILIVTALLVLGGFGGLVAWLSLTYVPDPPPVAAEKATPEAAQPAITTKTAPDDNPTDTAAEAPGASRAEASAPKSAAPEPAPPADPRKTADEPATAETPPAPETPETPEVTAAASETAAPRPEPDTPKEAGAPAGDSTPPEPAKPAETPSASPPTSAEADGESAEKTQAPEEKAAAGPYGPQSPLQRFANPPVSGDQPKIALILYNLGQSQAPTNAAINGLPGAVTLALSPYGNDLEGWTAKARAAGHEVLVETPMQPLDYPQSDYGPFTLLLADNASQIEDKLTRILSRFEGYIGTLSVRGGRFTAAGPRLQIAMKALRARGLLFVDSGDDSSSSTLALARQLDMPAIVVDRFLDDQISRTNIDRNLAELERLAGERGWAVGIGASYPATIERIGTWARSLPEKNVALVPLSSLAFRKP